MKKSILQKILAILARATIRKYKPKVIGITGSVGKTSAREAIFTVLKTKYSVRTSEKNYNNEIGLPLTILGISHHGRNIFKWLSAVFDVLFGVFWRQNKYPEILVLEYGLDHPGDMDYLLSIAKPDIGVVTAIGEIPVHVEFFKSPEELRAEKAKLIHSLSPSGLAILNHDDYAVYDLKEKTKARVVTFGFSAEGGSSPRTDRRRAHASGREEHAEMIKISNYRLQVTKDITVGDIPEGISFKIEHKGNMVPFRLVSCFGEPHAYAAAVAAAVGIALEINLVEIAEAMRSFSSPRGRLRLLKGRQHSFILDDTYNAAPEAMRKALDTLQALPGKRKIAVLGDMLEIGKYTEQVHRAIGNQAANFVDLLITVGIRAKFIAEEALAPVEGKRGLPKEQIISLPNSFAAGRFLYPLIKPGDLILVKGSQSMRMERAVEEIMAEPERAEKLLVRQDKYWKNR